LKVEGRKAAATFVRDRPYRQGSAAAGDQCGWRLTPALDPIGTPEKHPAG
jgi:hypothetical protein